MFLRYGVSRKTQQRYYIRELTNSKKDLQASLDLQERIVSSFSKDERTFLHLQTEKGFRKRRTYPHAMTLGIFMYSAKEKKEMLVAQQTIEFKADREIPLSSEIEQERYKVATLEGFMVDPNYRGNGFTDILLHHCCQIGESLGKDTFISCVDSENPFSYGVLLKNRFGIMKAYIDPEDSGKTYAFALQKGKNSSGIWYPSSKEDVVRLGFEGVQKKLSQQTNLFDNQDILFMKNMQNLVYA